MCSSKGCARAFLFLTNFLIFAVGCGALGVGIWLTVDKSTLFTLIKSATSTSNLNDLANSPSIIRIASIILLASGGALTIVGFSGCAGAWWEFKCLLFIYTMVSALLLLAFVAAGVLAAVFQAQSISYVEPFMIRVLNEAFDDMLPSTNTLSNAWFEMQQLFGCCGWYGKSDFLPGSGMASYWNLNATMGGLGRYTCVYLNSSSTSVICYNSSNVTVPSACCIYSNMDAIYALSKQQAQIKDATCPLTPTSTNSYTTGCRDQLSAFMSRNSIFIICIAAGAAILELLAIIASCSIIRALHEGSTYT